MFGQILEVPCTFIFLNFFTMLRTYLYLDENNILAVHHQNQARIFWYVTIPEATRVWYPKNQGERINEKNEKNDSKKQNVNDKIVTF